MSTKTCSICESVITPDATGWDGGHNALPVAEGRACGLCNAHIVIPARLDALRETRSAD